MCADVDLPEPLDIEHAFDAQNGHLSVPAERHRPRRATLRHTVVEKLVMDPSPGIERPGEE